MKFKHSQSKLGFKHRTSNWGWLTRAANDNPITWAYVEVQRSETLVETFFIRSADKHGGQAWAYDKVKELKKAKILRAFHGIVQEDQLIVVEQYDPKSKRWEEPGH